MSPPSGCAPPTDRRTPERELVTTPATRGSLARQTRASGRSCPGPIKGSEGHDHVGHRRHDAGAERREPSARRPGRTPTGAQWRCVHARWRYMGTSRSPRLLARHHPRFVDHRRTCRHSPQWLQPDSLRPEHAQRIEIDLFASQPEVKTALGWTVGPGRLEESDHRPCINRVADVHVRGDGLVRRAQSPVIDHDHTAAGQRTRKGDRARCDGRDRFCDCPEQVHAAVTCLPRVRRRVESLDDLRKRIQRPDPCRRGAGCDVAVRLERTRTAGLAGHQEHAEDNGGTGGQPTGWTRRCHRGQRGVTPGR
jgi:hypothetical protein